MKKRLGSLIREEEESIKEFFKRIFKRDFSGSFGLEIKNSLTKFAATLITKIGALFFTIVMARLLLPELFGDYSIAL